MTRIIVPTVLSTILSDLYFTRLLLRLNTCVQEGKKTIFTSFIFILTFRVLITNLKIHETFSLTQFLHESAEFLLISCIFF